MLYNKHNTINIPNNKMQQLLFFDTETTGLLPKYTSLHDVHKFPYIVQLSYIIFSILNNTYKTEVISDFVINLPNNIKISKEASDIHGITREKSSQSNITIDDALEVFMNDFIHMDKIIAHNISFDLTMIKVEILRKINEFTTNHNSIKLNQYNTYLQIIIMYDNYYCTMKSTTEYCNIITAKGYVKWPKLSELHNKMFSSIPHNLHNSLNDVFITIRCYFKHVYNIDIYNATKCLITRKYLKKLLK